MGVMLVENRDEVEPLSALESDARATACIIIDSGLVHLCICVSVYLCILWRQCQHQDTGPVARKGEFKGCETNANPLLAREAAARQTPTGLGLGETLDNPINTLCFLSGRPRVRHPLPYLQIVYLSPL